MRGKKPATPSRRQVRQNRQFQRRLAACKKAAEKDAADQAALIAKQQGPSPGKLTRKELRLARRIAEEPATKKDLRAEKKGR